MSDDSLYASELVTASDQELIDELVRRFKSSDQHGMIMVTGRPVEGDPERSDGRLTVSGTNPRLIQFLMGLLVRQFKLRGCADGRVEVPPLSLTNDGFLAVGDMQQVLPVTSSQLRLAFLSIPGVIEIISSSPKWYEFAYLGRLPHLFAAFAEWEIEDLEDDEVEGAEEFFSIFQDSDSVPNEDILWFIQRESGVVIRIDPCERDYGLSRICVTA